MLINDELFVCNLSSHKNHVNFKNIDRFYLFCTNNTDGGNIF